MIDLKEELEREREVQDTVFDLNICEMSVVYRNDPTLSLTMLCWMARSDVSTAVATQDAVSSSVL